MSVTCIPKLALYLSVFQFCSQIISAQSDSFDLYPIPEQENTRISSVYNIQTFDVPNALATRLFGLNDYGYIVGSVRKDGNSPQQGFLRDPTGTITIIEPPGSTLSQARGITNYGTIAGVYDDANGYEHGFVYKNGIYTTLDYPESISTAAYGISEQEEIVGAYTSPDGHFHGFRWRKGVFTAVDCPAEPDTAAIGINSFGVLTGDCDSNTPEGFSGFVSLGSSFYFRFDYPGALGTIGQGINDRFEIVGSYDAPDGNTHGFVLDWSGFTPLDVGGGSTIPHGISSRRVIVGFYFNTGPTHGFIATPRRLEETEH